MFCHLTPAPCIRQALAKAEVRSEDFIGGSHHEGDYGLGRIESAGIDAGFRVVEPQEFFVEMHHRVAALGGASELVKYRLHLALAQVGYELLKIRIVQFERTDLVADRSEQCRKKRIRQWDDRKGRRGAEREWIRHPS